MMLVPVDQSGLKADGAGQSNGDAKTDWKSLAKCAHAIKLFLRSLDKQAIGTGLMYFDRDGFQLRPRSNWFNNHTFQWVLTIGNKAATFEAVQESFTILIEKIGTLASHLQKFDPGSEDFYPAEPILIHLIRIQLVIDGIAKHGLAQLVKNYSQANKTQKAASLSRLGDDSFKKVKVAREELTMKLLPRIPGLDINVKLESYHFSARVLLQNRDAYRAHLNDVHVDPVQGLCLPQALVEDCLADCNHNSRPVKEALRVAARFINLPSMARSVPVQGGVTQWIPMRLCANPNGSIEVEESGVWGTCERDMNPDNICNVYYRVTPDTKQISISCGALNTAKKAEQLALVMGEVLQLVPKANGRWVVHQLNSFRQESRLIKDVHSHVYLNEDYFRSALKNEGISMLHVSTCYNSATMFKSEDATALKAINIDSLALLAGYIAEDLSKLLGQSNVNISSLKQQCASLCKQADELKAVKRKMKDHKVKEKLDRIDSIDNFVMILGENESKAQLQDDDAPQLFDSDELDAGHVQRQALLDEREEIERSLPAGIKQLRNRLASKQGELQGSLKGFTAAVGNAIFEMMAEDEKNPSTELSQAVLMLSIYERILKSQLKLSDADSLSRNTEIELFLLLYRLLEIKSIFICWSGLDRSGAVRALADSQAQMERELFQNHLRQQDAKDEKAEYAARMKACRKIFYLTLGLDVFRDELYMLTNSVVAESDGKFFLTADLKKLSAEKEPEGNLREALFRKIDERYSDSMNSKQEDLKLAQRYLEMAACHLLGAESQKTLFSTGVVGLKYLHDTYWPKRYFANSHPPDRWPMFCFVGKQAVQLVEYKESWFSTSRDVTKAAIVIFLRLSQLRGS